MKINTQTIGTPSNRATGDRVEFGWADPGPTQPHHFYLVDTLLGLLPKESSKILDVGCGNGYVTGLVAARGHKVMGVDFSKDGIDIAKKVYPEIQFEALSGIDDYDSLPAPVDVMLAIEVMEHMYLPRAFCKKAFRLVRPGGKFIVSVPYHGYLKNLAISLFDGWDHHFSVDWEGGHIKFFSKNSLSQMLSEAGFKNFSFHGVGRFPLLWKSMICVAEKPA